MAKQIITGDEPYYTMQDNTITDKSGITIKQKFIADFMIKHASYYGPMASSAAEKAFQDYLKIINGE